MADTPKIKLPPGTILEDDGEGGWRVVKTGEPMTNTIAFRLPSSTYATLLPFVDSFPERTLSAALRWLLDDGTVREVMAARIRRTSGAQ